MKVTYKWLKDYVDFDLTPTELAEKLTMMGLTAEEMIDQSKGLEKVVAGKITELTKHPNADRLSVCQVDIGTEKLQIVTGAPNVKAGDVIPVALIGADLPNGVYIKKSKLRGIESSGMMCSAQELGLNPANLPEDQQHGIMMLPQDTPLGTNVAAFLGLDDIVFDLEVTSNRPDWFGVIGIAREVAAIVGGKLHLPDLTIKEAGTPVTEMVKVTVTAPDLCPRYMARAITGVKIKPSPYWLQQRLEAVGMRSINNIVDITNYVMLEFGQPLHAFDFELLNDNTIMVRRAEPQEVIVTLDGNKRILNEEMLVIADAARPVAVAGVMGGENTEVRPETTDILLEAANFNGTSVRRTAQKLGFRSESSNRFEKGLDPNVAELASLRAAKLMAELGEGQIATGVIDLYAEPVTTRTMRLDPQRVNMLSGNNFTPAEMVELLNRLELATVIDGNELIVTIPSFRSDILREADLVEEIIRVYGYDRIVPAELKAVVRQGGKEPVVVLAEQLGNVLRQCGLSEILTYSFVNPNEFDLINLPADDPLRNAVRISNPLSEEQSIMRTTLLPSVLEVIARNINHRNYDVQIYELGRVYLPQEGAELPDERLKLVGAMTGLAESESWATTKRQVDFYDAKGVIETLFRELRINNVQFTPATVPAFHTGRTAEITLDGEKIGIIGELHPAVIANYDIEQPVYCFEVDCGLLMTKVNNTIIYRSLPKHPAANRDLAILVDENVNAGVIEQLIRQTGGKLLENVQLFDVYRGKQIPAGKKSMAYALVYRGLEKTLSEEEINQIHNKIIKRLTRELGAELRD